MKKRNVLHACAATLYTETQLRSPEPQSCSVAVRARLCPDPWLGHSVGQSLTVIPRTDRACAGSAELSCCCLLAASSLLPKSQLKGPSVQGYAQTNGKLQNGAVPYSHSSGQHGTHRQPGGAQPRPQYQANAGDAPARAPPARPSRAPRAAAAPPTQVCPSSSHAHRSCGQLHKGFCVLLAQQGATCQTG